MKVWVLTQGILEEHAQEYVAGVFSTPEGAAEALGEAFKPLEGKRYWWGTVTHPGQIGNVEEFEVQEKL